MNVLTMLNPSVALPVAQERRAPLRCTNLLVSRERSRRPVRRWIGRQLVRAGARLANDPTMRPVRAR
jgi:hypothetical protein